MLTAETASTVLLGVGGIQPALLGQLLVLLPPEKVQVGVVAFLARCQPLWVDGRLLVLRDVRVNPRANFLSEFLLLIRNIGSKSPCAPPCKIAFANKI